MVTRFVRQFATAAALVAILFTILGTTLVATSEANAAPCEQHKTKLMWRRCMSVEVDRLADAIGEKALDLCNGKTNNATGPTAVDERLACRIDKLSQTLQGMN